MVKDMSFELGDDQIKTMTILIGLNTSDLRNDERVETFFSPWMRHHAGRPTTGHSTETMGINTYSQRETDNYTQTLDK